MSKANGTINAIGKIITYILVVLLVLGIAGGISYFVLRNQGITYYVEYGDEKYLADSDGGSLYLPPSDKPQSFSVKSLTGGEVVMQGAIVQSDACIGSHCIINTGASVDHECLIADYVHISPHCTLCGNVQVGEGTWIGAGSVVIPGVKIGKWSIIGAGSVVTKDIPDGVLAVGNRCKIIKNIVL